MTSALRVIISGRVQGVGYRQWTLAKAAALGLTGYVRNLQDGSVEACFEGSSEVIDEMVAHCWKGPFFARVKSLERISAAPAGRVGFTIGATD
tara:strand:- start:45 stop:323 length:279 start_codon:yes stop_codon:yes gene_type:complete